MSCNDTFGVAHGREVDLPVPAQQQLDVRSDAVQLLGGKRHVAEKRSQQFGDALASHASKITAPRSRPKPSSPRRHEGTKFLEMASFVASRLRGEKVLTLKQAHRGSFGARTSPAPSSTRLSISRVAPK